MTTTLRYDAGASAYDRLTGRWSRMYVPRVMRAAGVAADRRVLDVATGTGDAALQAAAIVGPGGGVTAVDISLPMLREAARKTAGQPIDYVAADAQRLPFADGSFDAVVCLFGLMFVPAPGATLAGLRRLLRPGGAVVATCWDRPECAPFAGFVAQALADQRPDERGELLRPFALADGDATATIFRSAGFADVRCERVTHTSHFTSFAADFWEPIEAGGGRLGQAYLALPAAAREAVRRDVFARLPVRAPDEPFAQPHSAWMIVARDRKVP